MGTVVHAVSDGWLGAPWIFWSGLIGSGITASVAIATLVISNWQNLRRQTERKRSIDHALALGCPLQQ